MNLLEVTFLTLNLCMLVFGFLINYVNYIIPQCITQLFRYGRANISNAKPGYIKSIEVPKRWFWHFYLWAVLLQLLVLITFINGYYKNGSTSWLFHVLEVVGERAPTVSDLSSMIAATLFFFHLSRRLFETLFVSVYSNTKMNVIHYLLGFIHYTGAILCLVAHNPLLASKRSNNDSKVPIDNRIGVIEFGGIVLFLLGNYIQNRAHVGLANLRKNKNEDKKEASAHKIPRGGLFEYISCPNYFGEILIYIAVALIFGFQNSSWNQCLYWVVCNQITSGIMNQIWYRETFKDYPAQRKAVIPFVL